MNALRKKLRNNLESYKITKMSKKGDFDFFDSEMGSKTLNTFYSPKSDIFTDSYLASKKIDREISSIESLRVSRFKENFEEKSNEREKLKEVGEKSRRENKQLSNPQGYFVTEYKKDKEINQLFEGFDLRPSNFIDKDFNIDLNDPSLKKEKKEQDKQAERNGEEVTTPDFRLENMGKMVTLYKKRKKSRAQEFREPQQLSKPQKDKTNNHKLIDNPNQGDYDNSKNFTENYINIKNYNKEEKIIKKKDNLDNLVNNYSKTDLETLKIPLNNDNNDNNEQELSFRNKNNFSKKNSDEKKKDVEKFKDEENKQNSEDSRDSSCRKDASHDHFNGKQQIETSIKNLDSKKDDFSNLLDLEEIDLKKNSNQSPTQLDQDLEEEELELANHELKMEIDLKKIQIKNLREKLKKETEIFKITLKMKNEYIKKLQHDFDKKKELEMSLIEKQRNIFDKMLHKIQNELECKVNPK